MAEDEELSQYREQIDEIDSDIVELLAERFAVTADIGKHKAAAGLEAVDTEREKKHLTQLSKSAEEAGLDPEFVMGLFRHIIEEVVRRHEELQG